MKALEKILSEQGVPELISRAAEIRIEMEKINLLSEEIQNMYHAINEKYSNESKTMLEKLESISTELEQTKEFTKILIANELLDELK